MQIQILEERIRELANQYDSIGDQKSALYYRSLLFKGFDN